jgi:metal-responsive CopG/Arc/MetJ family transcriptional regulator
MEVKMKRTTIMADEETLYTLSRIARRKGESTSAVIREALVDYIERHGKAGEKAASLRKIVALGSSGEKHLSSRVAETILAEISPTHGLSLPQSAKNGNHDSD